MSGGFGAIYLESVLFRFSSTKELGDKALAELSDADLRWTPGPESNSIAVILQHLHGNMLSRWTEFLNSDGEKPTRNRDGEFVEPQSLPLNQALGLWEEGWACLLSELEALTPDDLLRTVRIRGQELSAMDAINRQLAHVSYHVGQIVYLARMRKGGAWKSLSIPRGASLQYTPRRRD